MSNLRGVLWASRYGALNAGNRAAVPGTLPVFPRMARAFSGPFPIPRSVNAAGSVSLAPPIRAPSTPSTGTCSDNRPGKNAFLRCEGYIPHCADSYLLCKGYLEWLIQGIGRPMPMPFRRFGRSATWAGTPCKADSCPGKRKCTPYNRVIHNFPPFCLK